MSETPRTDAFVKTHNSKKYSSYLEPKLIGHAREMEQAYTAAHSELERAVADLAACREVADREREQLAYVYTKQMNALVRPLMTYAEWLAAIDAAIKEQSHELARQMPGARLAG